MERSNDNEKALKILEQQYAGFVNATNWEFFRGLANYVKTIEKMVPTKQLVNALEKQREISTKTYEVLKSTAFLEFEGAAKKITQNLTEAAKRLAPVSEAIKQINDQLAGITLTSDPLFMMDNSLFDLAVILKGNGYIDAIKQFEDEKKRVKNIYGNFTFSPAYEKIDHEEKILKRQQETEPWGVWTDLSIAEKVVLEPEELNKEARKDLEYLRSNKNVKPYVIDELEDLRVQEMDLIRLGNKDAKEAIFFNITKYKDYAKRIHIYITTELLKADADNKLDFDDTQSILYFAGEDIKISERAQSNPHDLLRTIFKDRGRVWNTDEVLEDWKFALGGKQKSPRLKVYQAGKELNRIIASKVQIDDFIVVSTKSVAINKKYLKT